MFDWPMVVLVLGLSALAVVVYYVRARDVSAKTYATIGELRATAEGAVRLASGYDKRLSNIEAALRIDGAKAMAEAARGNLPAMMRMILAATFVAMTVGAVAS
jgi:hypothetical protein